MLRVTTRTRVCCIAIWCLLVSAKCSESEDTHCNSVDMTCDIGDKPSVPTNGVSIKEEESTEARPVALVLGHPKIKVSMYGGP